LKWTNQYTSTNPSDEIYILYKKSGATNWDSPTVSANTNTWVHTTAEAGQIYDYQVRVYVTTGGGIYSDYSNTATATMPAAPTITTHPQNKTIAVGQNTSFFVAASSTMPITYQWEYLDGSTWKAVPNYPPYSTGEDTPTLTMADVDTIYDNMVFRCVVTNSAGSKTSNSATLTVTATTFVAATDITGVPTTAAVGTPLTLTGTVTPATATNKTITWSVKNAGTTGATISGSTFNATAAGTATITATIVNGATATTPYIKDFTITVSAAGTGNTVTAPGTGNMSNFKKSKTYTSGMFSDVNESQWYGYTQQKVIANAYEYGLMQGSGNTFNPTGNMTIAEAVTIAARVHHIYNGGTGEFTQGSPWYQVYVDYAIGNGIIGTGTFSDYNKAATRAEMAFIFSSALPSAEFAAQNTVNSLPDVNNSTPYYSTIIMLYKAGIVAGSDNIGTFNPGSNITRAEASAIISRVILPATRMSGKTF
jgi:uncharacterized protein YjdB